MSGAASSLTRQAQIFEQSERAAHDVHFRRLVVSGDAARDDGNWQQAESLYAHALSFYPFQPGYRVQLAHMAKEQGRFVEAGLHYRTALALGYPVAEIGEHIAFVEQRNGHAMEKLQAPDLAVTPLAAPPTGPDLETLAFVLLHRAGSIAAEEALDFLRQCRSNSEVATALIADVRFQHANLPFLELLRT